MNDWPNENVCKNHNTIEAGYFLVEQPWLKFCSGCALNMALCGKRIEKQLTSHQFERKMILSTLSNEIKRVIETQNECNNVLNSYVEQIQRKYSRPMSQKLKIIDNHISLLMKSRDQVYHLYENQVSKKLNSLFERQSKSILNSLELKKQIQYVQSNFGNLIELKEENQFKDKTDFLNELVTNTKNTLHNNYELINLEQQIRNTYLKINEKLKHIQKISFQIDQKDSESSENRILQTSQKQNSSLSIQKKQINPNYQGFQKNIQTTRCQLQLRSTSKRSQNSINTSKSKQSFYPPTIRKKSKKQSATFTPSSIFNSKIYDD